MNRMDFDEEEEEIGMHHMEAVGTYQPLGNSGMVRVEAQAAAVGGGGGAMTRYRYRECLKNHAVGIAGHAVDGCGDFMPAGEDGTLDAHKCAACGCHRNFHRKEEEYSNYYFAAAPSYRTPPPSYHHHHPSGYLHVTPHRPLVALPSNSREDDMSNPSSSGGGGGGGESGSGSKKRFRTKFSPEQKEKMLAFAEQLEWHIQKDDEAVQQFCANTNIKRQVFKVWMHNNKHTLGKKP